MGVMDYFEETKYALCGSRYVSKEIRQTFLWTLFATAKKNDVSKSDAKRGIAQVEKELLGDVKRIPKEKRDFIIRITHQNVMEAFFGVYGAEVEEAKPAKPVVKEIVEEAYEIDFNNILNDEYAVKKGIARGPKMSEKLDLDFCAKIGYKV